MKKFWKEFFLRGLVCASGGPVVLAIIYGILGATGTAEAFSPREVCVGILTITLLAFIAAGMTAIYQMEQLPLPLMILLHGGVLYIAYILTYLINGWVLNQLKPILVFTGIFIGCYGLIWTIIYNITRAKTEALNRKLKDKLEQSDMDAIRIEGLTKKYKDVVAVDNLSLSVRQGELFSLLGVNGAGKTTTIKMLSCLTQPTSGDAFLNGKSICKDPASVKSLIAVSPQETAVAPGLSARENLELMCGVHGFTKEKRNDRIKELTERLGLETVMKKKTGKLSGGWQRRLGIAMALISEPEILFLDEPTLGLDVLARSELWDMIRSLKGKVTIVLTTHYMEEAETLSDRIAIMKDGKLLICDTPEKIKEAAGTDHFEQAFVRIVQEAAK